MKQGEIVEVTQGAIGNKIGTFNLTIGDDLGSRYLDYDADVIYNDLKDLFSTSSIQKDAFFVRDWGMATFVEGGAVDAKDRLLHVGIDYTQYVTEDGTTLKNMVHMRKKHLLVMNMLQHVPRQMEIQFMYIRR